MSPSNHTSFLSCRCPCVDAKAENIDEAEFPFVPPAETVRPKRPGTVLVAPWEANPHMQPETIGFAPRSVPRPGHMPTKGLGVIHETAISDSTSGIVSVDAVSSSATTNASHPNIEGVLEVCFSVSGKFWHRGTHEETISFASKPLGMEFVRGKKPFVVKSIERGGTASKMGVKPGWVVLSIQGQPVDDMEYSKFIVLLNEQCRTLKSTKQAL